MFSLRRKANECGLTAIVPSADGLCIASVCESEKEPVVKVFEYTAWETVGSRSEILREKIKSHGLQTRPCLTTLNLGEYSVLSVEAPDVPEDELKLAVRWQIKDLVDYGIDEAVIDVFNAPLSGADGRQKNLYVVAANSALVQNRVLFLQEARANINIIDVPELACRNICGQLEQDEEGIACVYLEKDQGIITITRKGILYIARSLDFGYADLTAVEAGGEDLRLGDYAQYDRLVLELQRSLDYYDRYFVQPPIAAIVVAPMPVKIDHLYSYLEESLGYSAQQLDLNQHIRSEVTLNEHDQVHGFLAIAAAMRKEAKSL